MATKTITTRLQLKYDSYENWTSNDPVLLSGEVAIATISEVQDGVVNTVPSVLVKVGDGEHKFSELNFISALAADVYSYAKKPEADFIAWIKEITAETYDAKGAAAAVQALLDEYKESNDAALEALQGEVDALEALVGTLPEGTTATSVIEYVNAKTAGIATDAALEEVNNQLNAAQAAIDAIEADYLVEADKTELSGLITAEKERAEGIESGLETRLAAVEADYLKAADKYDDTQVKADIKANNNLIVAIKDGAELDSFLDVENALAANKTASDEADAKVLEDAKAYVDEKATALQTQVDANKTAVEQAQSEVDALEAVVGEVAEGKTVVGLIEEAKQAAITGATYDDTAVKELIQGNTDAIDAIEADYLKAADKTELSGLITAEKERAEGVEAGLEGRIETMEAFWEAAAADGTDTNVIDTLKEIQEYIAGDETGASEMLAKINQNTSDIEALEGRMDTAEGEIDALQADSHTHANKALLDTYTQTEADLADAVAKKHAHANATVLDGITAKKVAAWDASEANAIAKAEELNTAMNTRVAAIEEDYLKAADKTELQGNIDLKADQTSLDGVEERVAAIEADYLTSTDVLILNCGTSVIE